MLFFILWAIAIAILYYTIVSAIPVEIVLVVVIKKIIVVIPSFQISFSIQLDYSIKKIKKKKKGKKLWPIRESMLLLFFFLIKRTDPFADLWDKEKNGES